MSLGTKIYTWFYGNFVGTDELGNKYYCDSKDFKTCSLCDTEKRLGYIVA